MYSIATVHSSGPWGIQYLALYVEFEFVVGQRILFAPTGEAQPAWYSPMPGVAATTQRAKLVPAGTHVSMDHGHLAKSVPTF